MTVWKSKHKIENISASNTAMKLKLGEHVIACYINAPDGVYFDVAMATTQIQIAIMQEWLPLYVILSKHCPLPKG